MPSHHDKNYHAYKQMTAEKIGKKLALLEKLKEKKKKEKDC